MSDDVPPATDSNSTPSRLSDANESSAEASSASPSSSDNEPTVALGRERRANAGSRMAKLIELAGAEDELAEEEGYGEIFREAADDDEFADNNNADDGDVSMSSSSEDEADTQQDEDAGETDLMKEERIAKGKKRKRETLLQQTMRLRRLKYPTVLGPADQAKDSPPRKKAKAERVSWIVNAGLRPARSSSRKHAIASKQATYQRMKENEKRRERAVAIMQAAEERKRARAERILTQEDRLAQAAEVERINSNSLNRWEESEKKRLEEQRARLDALKNRTLQGPVITYWSGPAMWRDGKFTVIGKSSLIKEVDEEMEVEEHEEHEEQEEKSKESQNNDAEKPAADGKLDPGPTDQDDSQQDNTKAGADPPSLPEKEQAPQASADEPDPESPEVTKPTVEENADQNSQLNILASVEGNEDSAKDLSQATKKPSQEESTAVSSKQVDEPMLEPKLNEQSEPKEPNDSNEPHGSNDQNEPNGPDELNRPNESSGPNETNESKEQSTTNEPHQQQGSDNMHLEQRDSATPASPGAEQDPNESSLPTLAARSLIILRSFPKLPPAPSQPARERSLKSGQTTRYSRTIDRDGAPLIRALFTVPPAETDHTMLDKMAAAAAAAAPSASASASASPGLGADDADDGANYAPYDPLQPASVTPRHSTRYATKRATQCAITGHVARYRDPETALPYATAPAYKSIRRLLDVGKADVEQKGRKPGDRSNVLWSTTFQAWIDDGKPAAKVPLDLWYGTAKADSTEDKKEKES